MQSGPDGCSGTRHTVSTVISQGLSQPGNQWVSNWIEIVSGVFDLITASLFNKCYSPQSN